MKPPLHVKWFVILLLSLASIAGLRVEGYVSPSQDPQRKIVSDDFIKSRREVDPRRKGRSRGQVRRPTYRLVSNPAAGSRPPPANFEELGITIWRLRPARTGDSGRRALIREKSKGSLWAAERVQSDGTFREGDYIRISVESPRGGYLYVVDRDVLADGSTGEAMLIFPWAEADNKLVPGSLIDIPGQEEDPNHFTARITRHNQVGELLTFIVTATPLDLPLSDKPLHIESGELSRWEKLWGGVSERYEMEGGVGQAWTQEEKQAAAKKTRQLTRDDPGPQTIYRVSATNTKAMLVNVRLSYGK
ncbi:MAG TPA: hypothetical protein VFX97_03570 [Pyrinomonadaceae bacterium]|nr:hypothetical protein [Pyrinomonadaceae bacterium]